MYKITLLFLAVNFMVEATDWSKYCNKRFCGQCSEMIMMGKGTKSKIQQGNNL